MFCQFLRFFLVNVVAICLWTFCQFVLFLVTSLFFVNVYSPHWLVGFLFLVLYPLLPPSSRPVLPILPPTHSLTHTLTHSLNHSLTHSHSLTLTHSLSLTHSHSLSLTLTHSHSLSLTLTHSLLTHSHSLTHSLARSPRSLAHSLTQSLTHSLTLLRGRRGTWCTGKGSDVRPGVPPVSLGLRRSAGGFCVAGAGLGALQRGWMYALASLRCPLVSAALPVAFAWQARDFALER